MVLGGLAFLVYIEVTATLLNLVPLPPFDGFGALRPWLPEGIRRAESEAGPTLGLICMAIVFAVVAYIPTVSGAFMDATAGLGVPRRRIGAGSGHFRLF